MNTAIASAKDPLLMAEAMRQGVEAGRKAFLAGRIPKKLYATASSPLDGLLVQLTSVHSDFALYLVTDRTKPKAEIYSRSWSKRSTAVSKPFSSARRI